MVVCSARAAGASSGEVGCARGRDVTVGGVAVSLHYVLRCCAVAPTGVKAAEAVSAALDRAEIERHASDGVLHPPTRDATVAGLTALIDERTHQLEYLTERHVENDPGTCITTTFTGITTAFRQVLRERDVLIDARDIV